MLTFPSKDKIKTFLPKGKFKICVFLWENMISLGGNVNLFTLSSSKRWENWKKQDFAWRKKLHNYQESTIFCEFRFKSEYVLKTSN